MRRGFCDGFPSLGFRVHRVEGFLRLGVSQGLIRFCKGAITGFAGRCKQGSLQ